MFSRTPSAKSAVPKPIWVLAHSIGTQGLTTGGNSLLDRYRRASSITELNENISEIILGLGPLMLAELRESASKIELSQAPVEPGHAPAARALSIADKAHGLTKRGIASKFIPLRVKFCRLHEEPRMMIPGVKRSNSLAARSSTARWRFPAADGSPMPSTRRAPFLRCRTEELILPAF